MEPIYSVKYKLTEEQYKKCLIYAKIVRKPGIRVIIETALLVLVTAYQIYLSLTEPGVVVTRFLIIGVSLVLGFALWVMPFWDLKRKSKSLAASSSGVAVSVYEDKLEIGEGGGLWEIPLDGSHTRSKNDGELFLVHHNHQHLPVLLSAFEGEGGADAIAAIEQGVIEEKI